MSEELVCIGDRIKRLREGYGLSRRALAQQIGVDLTAIGAWERGQYLPRPAKRRDLAAALGVTSGELFTGHPPHGPDASQLINSVHRFPQLLQERLLTTARNLKVFRLAAPYSAAAYVQPATRQRLADRISRGTLEVERAEIFYNLQRVQEIVSNIFRYDGRAYYVKAYCAGVEDVMPGMGGYIFDDSEILVGGYWTAMPPHHQPSMALDGEPYQTYFARYWEEIWRRGTLLNISGASDLSAARAVAQKLGLPASQWANFVEEARAMADAAALPPVA